jgi:hypothetical protein
LILNSRRTAVSIAFVAMTFAAGVAVAPMSTAASAPSLVGVSSADPLPDNVPAAQLAGARTGVTADADTPDGFTLQHPGFRRSNYVYDSDTVYQGTYHCTDDACKLMAEVTVQLHEVAIGGTSHTWELTSNMKKYKNPGNYTWSYSATYWCGVNISGASDTICANGAAPSHVSMSVNTVVNKPWGSKNGITVFPMVQASTLFSNGVHVTTKFRGWDTLSRARTTQLKATSGTGN